MDVIEGNKMWAVFLFDHIYIVKHLLNSWDDLFENLGETTVLAGKMFTSWSQRLNTACDPADK